MGLFLFTDKSARTSCVTVFVISGKFHAFNKSVYNTVVIKVNSKTTCYSGSDEEVLCKVNRTSV